MKDHFPFPGDIVTNTTTSTSSAPAQSEPQQFARLSRWLDMFDEIRHTDPKPTEK